jgi:hypothetical protein
MKVLGYLARAVLSLAAGVTLVLAVSTYGCDDVGGVPSWERCHSFLSNSTIEWWGLLSLVPLVAGVGLGGAVWWLLGRSERVAAVTVGIVLVAVTAAWAPLVIDVATGI